MIKVIGNCWALFLGLMLIMLGNGLQGSLLGLRAEIEGFSISTIGFVMSGYFVGLIAGSIGVPKIVSRVGHIRTFGALASLASTSILVHLAFPDPWVWWTMRVVTGLALAGIYIVAESWLNDMSDNETRGQLLSVYMLILFGSMAGGQLMLNLAGPDGFQLFVLISVLVSMAVIPILVSVSRAPVFDTIQSVSIVQLYRVSPLGVFGMFASGIATGSIFGVGVLYASAVGLGVAEVSLFMTSVIVGGVGLQYPIGWLSDRIGRRRAIILVCLAGTGAAGAAAVAGSAGWMIFAAGGLVGGLALPLYSLCAAHTNDYLDPQQMVAASGTLVLANGTGSVLGAPLAAVAMDTLGAAAFYQIIAASFALVCLFAIWRSTQREALASEDTGDFVPYAPSPISAAFNPDVDLEEIEAAAEADKEEVVASFEELVEELAPDTNDEEPGAS